MNDLTYYTLMANYNQWMNQKLYGVCDQISDQERKSDRGAFFRSIHGTLNHLLYGDKAWMGRFTEQPFYVPNWGQMMYDDFELLKQERQKVDQQMIEWTNNLNF